MGLSEDEAIIVGSIIGVAIIIVFGLVLWYCCSERDIESIDYTKIEQIPPNEEQPSITTRIEEKDINHITETQPMLTEESNNILNTPMNVEEDIEIVMIEDGNTTINHERPVEQNVYKSVQQTQEKEDHDHNVQNTVPSRNVTEINENVTVHNAHKSVSAQQSSTISETPSYLQDSKCDKSIASGCSTMSDEVHISAMAKTIEEKHVSNPGADQENGFENGIQTECIQNDDAIRDVDDIQQEDIDVSDDGHIESGRSEQDADIMYTVTKDIDHDTKREDGGAMRYIDEDRNIQMVIVADTNEHDDKNGEKRIDIQTESDKDQNTAITDNKDIENSNNNASIAKTVQEMDGNIENSADIANTKACDEKSQRDEDVQHEMKHIDDIRDETDANKDINNRAIDHENINVVLIVNEVVDDETVMPDDANGDIEQEIHEDDEDEDIEEIKNDISKDINDTEQIDNVQTKNDKNDTNDTNEISNEINDEEKGIINDKDDKNDIQYIAINDDETESDNDNINDIDINRMESMINIAADVMHTESVDDVDATTAVIIIPQQTHDNEDMKDDTDTMDSNHAIQDVEDNAQTVTEDTYKQDMDDHENMVLHDVDEVQTESDSDNIDDVPNNRIESMINIAAGVMHTVESEEDVHGIQQGASVEEQKNILSDHKNIAITATVNDGTVGNVFVDDDGDAYISSNTKTMHQQNVENTDKVGDKSEIKEDIDNNQLQAYDEKVQIEDNAEKDIDSNDNGTGIDNDVDDKTQSEVMDETNDSKMKGLKNITVIQVMNDDRNEEETDERIVGADDANDVDQTNTDDEEDIDIPNKTNGTTQIRIESMINIAADVMHTESEDDDIECGTSVMEDKKNRVSDEKEENGCIQSSGAVVSENEHNAGLIEDIEHGEDTGDVKVGGDIINSNDVNVVSNEDVDALYVVNDDVVPEDVDNVVISRDVDGNDDDKQHIERIKNKISKEINHEKNVINNEKDDNNDTHDIDEVQTESDNDNVGNIRLESMINIAAGVMDTESEEDVDDMQSGASVEKTKNILSDPDDKNTAMTATMTDKDIEQIDRNDTGNGVTGIPQVTPDNEDIENDEEQDDANILESIMGGNRIESMIKIATDVMDTESDDDDIQNVTSNKGINGGGVTAQNDDV